MSLNNKVKGNPPLQSLLLPLMSHIMVQNINQMPILSHVNDFIQMQWSRT